MVLIVKPGMHTPIFKPLSPKAAWKHNKANPQKELGANSGCFAPQAEMVLVSKVESTNYSCAFTTGLGTCLGLIIVEQNRVACAHLDMPSAENPNLPTFLSSTFKNVRFIALAGYDIVNEEGACRNNRMTAAIKAIKSANLTSDILYMPNCENVGYFFETDLLSARLLPADGYDHRSRGVQYYNMMSQPPSPIGIGAPQSYQ